jgi:uncharacterized protein (DUF58 family)
MLTTLETRQLAHLTLGVATASPAPGARQAHARGFGLEFDDYRRYQAGDDPRSIDWTVEARLRQLVVRVFRAEGHMRLHVLMDISGSMRVGTPSKLCAAARLAAALAYVAAARRDAVGLATFDDRVRTRLMPATGRLQLHRILETLTESRAMGPSAIDRALVSYAGTVRGPGLALVISDLLVPDHTYQGLRYLLYRGLTPAVIQVLADEDVRPPIDGRVEIVDAERPEDPPLVVDPAAARTYIQRVATLAKDVERFCTTQGLPYVQLRTSATFERMLEACVAAGLLGVYA